jgi:hypothetical protein
MGSKNTTGGGRGTTRDIHGRLHLNGQAITRPEKQALPLEVDPASLMRQLTAISQTVATQMAAPDDLYEALPAGVMARTPELARALLDALAGHDGSLAQQRSQEMAACRTPEGLQEVADMVLEDMDNLAAGMSGNMYFGEIDGMSGTLGFWSRDDRRSYPFDSRTEAAL